MVSGKDQELGCGHAESVALCVTPVAMGRDGWSLRPGVGGDVQVGEMHLEVTSI